MTETGERISWMYRLTSGFAIVGLTAGTFCSTVLTNEYGGSFGAVVTALWIVLLVVGHLLVAPYLPYVIGRFGARPTFLTVKVASLVLWVTLGMLLVVGAVGVPALYATAPFFGALAAFASTLTTLYSGAYIPGHRMSGALVRMAVVRGISVALGALMAALVAITIGPAWGIVARGAFEIPLLLVLVFARPGSEPGVPAANPQVWRRLRDDLRDNPALRRLILLGVGLTIFAMPFSELLVPIASGLRQADPIPGAALLVASIALGQVFSLYPVSWLQGRLPVERSSAVMGFVRGGCLAVYGVTALVLSGGWELAAWAVIGLAFGMSRAASGALMAGAAIASVAKEDSSRALVAFSFCCTLASPIGLLLWGVIIDTLSVEAALFTGAIGVAAVCTWVYRKGSSQIARA